MAKKPAPPHCCWIDDRLYARINYKVTQPDGSVKWKQATQLITFERTKIPSDSPKDAARTVRELQNEFDQHKGAGFSRDSLNAFLDEWLDNISSSVDERTYEDYRDNLRRYVRPVIGSKQLAKLEIEDVKDVFNRMKRTVSERTKRTLAARTIDYARTILSMAFKYAVERHLLRENLVKYTKPPKKEHKERVWLKEETRAKFFEAVENEPYGLMFEFMLVSGLRPSEYMGLQWDDVDWDKEMVSVVRTLYRRRSLKEKRAVNPDEPSWRFKGVKRANSERIVTLPSWFMSKLKRHQIKQDQERLKAKQWMTEDTDGKPMRLIFCTAIGSPLCLSKVHNSYFKPILEKYGLEDMRLYDIRHSYASWLYEEGETTKTISELLGNSPAMCEEIYLHVDESKLRRATDKLERKPRQLQSAGD